MSKMPLWNSDDAAIATGAAKKAEWCANGVSIDTRTLNKGDLFIALRGPKHDGHHYIAEAIAKGAAAVIADRKTEKCSSNTPILYVADTLEALRNLGKYARRRTSANIIAVTGSAGKTGTKDALFHVLSSQGKTTASIASYNNHFGVPLSLARMHADDKFGIFEIGMNQKGEIASLTKMVLPHIVIITTIEAAHIEFFKNLEEIADAKAEIFQGLDRNGTAILNMDNTQFTRLQKSANQQKIKNIISFGRKNTANAKIISSTISSEGSNIEAVICGQHIRYWLNLQGVHQITNSLAVLATIHALNANLESAAKILGKIEALPGRGKHHKLLLPSGTFTLIDESYNANPASMKAAIQVLGSIQIAFHGRRIAVLGDMKELGRESKKFHADLSKYLVNNGIDRVYATGDEIKAMFDELPQKIQGKFSSCVEIVLEHLLEELSRDDVVMVKGSFTSGMRHVVSVLRDKFSRSDQKTRKQEGQYVI